MSLRNDNHLFDRIGKKQRQRLMFSAELAHVLDDVQGAGQVSQFVERAAWRMLVQEYGRDEVQAAIEDAQAEIGADDRLASEKPYTLEA
jgi:serine kinase of HPr protein (carbohydrate metabolism regulator)